MTPAEIAAKLTEAQRKLFLRPLLAPVNGPKGVRGGFAKELVLPQAPVKPNGCFYLYATTPGYEKFQLTPLGLAVRAILEEQDNAN